MRRQIEENTRHYDGEKPRAPAARLAGGAPVVEVGLDAAFLRVERFERFTTPKKFLSLFSATRAAARYRCQFTRTWYWSRAYCVSRVP